MHLQNRYREKTRPVEVFLLQKWRKKIALFTSCLTPRKGLYRYNRHLQPISLNKDLHQEPKLKKWKNGNRSHTYCHKSPTITSFILQSSCIELAIILLLTNDCSLWSMRCTVLGVLSVFIIVFATFVVFPLLLLVMSINILKGKFTIFTKLHGM